MRIYTGLIEMFKEVERDVCEMGTVVHPESYQDQRVGSDEKFITKELQGYCYRITSHTGLEKQAEELGVDKRYLTAEFLDRIAVDHRNPGTSWKLRREVWEEFLHQGKFAYTYNERIRVQLPWILDQLRMNPNTRQAVITLYDHHQDLSHMGGIARIPCSMHYQYLVRERKGEVKLDCIYTMRSCDLYTHFLYDVVLSMFLQNYIANSVGLLPGSFTHFIGSLHAYKKDYDTKGVF